MTLVWHVPDFNSSEPIKHRLDAAKKELYTPPISQGATTKSAMIKIITRAGHCNSKWIFPLLDWQLHVIRKPVGIIAQTLRIAERSFVQM